jgi:lipopolysaccharide transport system permease protein
MSDIQWTTLIKPKAKFFDLNLKEVFYYRGLITLFVKRDFVAYYQQALLGPFWYIIQLLISTIVFSVIFETVAKIYFNGVPVSLFYVYIN